jgi:hypothetical protein
MPSISISNPGAIAWPRAGLAHRSVCVQQPPVQLVVSDPLGVLEVLVKQGEDVRLHRPGGVPGRPLPAGEGGHAVGEVVSGVLGGGPQASGTGPPSLTQLNKKSKFGVGLERALAGVQKRRAGSQTAVPCMYLGSARVSASSLSLAMIGASSFQAGFARGASPAPRCSAHTVGTASPWRCR